MKIKRIIKKIVTSSNYLSALRRKFDVFIEERKHKKRIQAYLKTDYPNQIRKLRNSKKGERCFVIGNGPSLRCEDLDKLKGEYCFAANRIWLMYDKTDWRPTYYMCQDWKMIVSECTRMNKYPAPVFVGFDGMYEQNISLDNAIGYLCDKRPYVNRQNPFPFSYECDKSIIDGSVVTYSAIQLAIYMGFKEIYLIGVDNNYQYTVDKNKRITVHNDVKEAHFDPRYKEIILQNSKEKSVIFGISDLEMCNLAYESAQNAAEKFGVSIFNATRGGKLESFTRKNFDDLFV